MKFSLIVPTIGRTGELVRFLEHLAEQWCHNAEVLVVDQNPGDGLKLIVERFSTSMPITYLKSAPGLSRARNVALPLISGEIVGFPDDDCWYPRGLLKGIRDFFEGHKDLDGITALPADEEGNPFLGRRCLPRTCLNRLTAWNHAISWVIFLKRRVIEQVGLFDETLGVGAGTPWQSGEETDYVLRALEKGFRICSEPSLVVHHEAPKDRFGLSERKKAYRYALGSGRVLRKHHYPFLRVVFNHFMLPLATALILSSLGNWNKALFHCACARGRLRGYWGST